MKIRNGKATKSFKVVLISAPYLVGKSTIFDKLKEDTYCLSASELNMKRFVK